MRKHTVIWDGLDARDHAVSSGVYLYLLETDGFREHRKLVLVR